MKWGVLWVYIVWYGLISLIFLIIPSNVQTGAVVTGSFVDVNSTGFSDSEIDSGGFFGGIIGIATAIGRFLGFIFIGLVPSGWGVPSSVSTFFLFWNSAITLSFIAWFVSNFWNG